MKDMLRELAESRLQQGDIIRNVDMPEYSSMDGEEAILTVTRFPFVVVLTQDCDLAQNHTALESGKGGGRLVATLVAPAYHIADAQAGNQLDSLGITMPSLPKKAASSQSAKDLYTNRNLRYHCVPLSKVAPPLPDLLVDFKQYFSVNSEYLTAMKGQCLLASLNDLYREDLCQRFASYLSRIGLPEPISAM